MKFCMEIDRKYTYKRCDFYVLAITSTNMVTVQNLSCRCKNLYSTEVDQ